MDRCRYHKDIPLLTQDDTPVVYVQAVSRDDGTKQLLGYGLTPERVAVERAHKESGTYPFINPLGETYQNEFMFEYQDPGINPTETLNGLIRRLGFDHQIEELPRDYWLTKIQEFLGMVPGIPSIQEVYLVGGLAAGKEATKDADLLLVVDCCELGCPLANIENKLDFFCFTEEEFEQLKSGNFRITGNMQILYRRDGTSEEVIS